MKIIKKFENLIEYPSREQITGRNASLTRKSSAKQLPNASRYVAVTKNAKVTKSRADELAQSLIRAQKAI